MRFKIDENLPAEVADLIRQQGHDACSVAEQGLQGYEDAAIAAVCQVEKRIIITLDLDFADVRQYPPQNYAGIIVLRPFTQMNSVLFRMVQQLLVLLPQESVTGCLWVMDDHQVRIRDANSSSY